MFSPREQQMDICLLKINLEEIVKDVVNNRSAITGLDTENEECYSETMTMLRDVRSLNTEIERLKYENIRLTAKRMQLKEQCVDMMKKLIQAREARTELENSLKQEEQEEELQITKYEDSLQKKADQFRNTRMFYNEDEMTRKIEVVKAANEELERDMLMRQNNVADLKKQLDALQSNVPEDLLTIVGKLELDENVKALTDKCDNLREKRNLLNSQQNPSEYKKMLETFKKL